MRMQPPRAARCARPAGRGAGEVGVLVPDSAPGVLGHTDIRFAVYWVRTVAATYSTVLDSTTADIAGS